VGLQEHRGNLAKNLSGGNKRKLAIAIALIADSRFVLLDEPTSGLDLEARRKIWSMLKEYKRDRIVIITTHNMNEADIISDRIGIMSNGKMTCLGSSKFLRNKFGPGYNLDIIMKEGADVSKLYHYLKG